jgi:hypothetical protein
MKERVCDRAVLGLVRAMLRAGVMQDGSLRRGMAGTPLELNSFLRGWAGYFRTGSARVLGQIRNYAL